MPYWMYCIRCNKDGSFQNVDRDCGKCSGIGQDWRCDDELDWAKDFAQSNGLELYHEDEFPKFNHSGERVYSTLDEYKEANKDPQPTGYIQPNAEDDEHPGDYVDHFVSIYLELRDQNTQLYRFNAPNEGLLTGAFDLFALDTNFPFLNQEYLAEAEKNIESFESNLNNSVDLFRRMDDSELMDFLRINPEMFASLRAQELVAHENFHVLQAFTLGSVFSLAQSYRAIDHWRNYFGVMALHTGATFKEGECIFDTVRHIPDHEKFLSPTLHDLSKKAKQALNAAERHVDGLSVMDLIEGSAFIAQKIAVRTFTVPTFSIEDKPLYVGAWQIYQSKGGGDELAFLLACLAALRFGDIKSGYAHPVDIFLSLAQSSSDFESTDMAAFSPPSFGKCFGPRDVTNRGHDDKYFGHLDVSDERQMVSLAQYRQEANEEVNGMVDLALKISKKITQHVKSHFGSVSMPVGEEEMSASYIDDFLKAFGKSIYENFPAANTEEFYLRFLFDDSLRQAFTLHCINATGDTAVQEIGGNKLNVYDARALSDILQRFEAVALYDPEKQTLLPYCCDQHPKPEDIEIVIRCQQEGSLNVLIHQLCGRELRELIV